MKRETWLEKGFTEEQVTDILNEFHNSNSGLQNQINSLKDFEQKYNAVQKQLDDINKANLSKEEQMALKEKELEVREQKAIQREKETNMQYNTAKVKSVLASYDVEDEIIATLVTDDEMTSLNNANRLKAKFDLLAESSAKKAKDEIQSLNVKPNLSNVNQTDDVMTWDKYTSMSIEDQNKFQEEHPTEFANL